MQAAWQQAEQTMAMADVDTMLAYLAAAPTVPTSGATLAMLSHTCMRVFHCEHARSTELSMYMLR